MAIFEYLISGERVTLKNYRGAIFMPGQCDVAFKEDLKSLLLTSKAAYLAAMNVYWRKNQFDVSLNGTGNLSVYRPMAFDQTVGAYIRRLYVTIPVHGVPDCLRMTMNASRYLFYSPSDNAAWMNSMAWQVLLPQINELEVVLQLTKYMAEHKRYGCALAGGPLDPQAYELERGMDDRCRFNPRTFVLKAKFHTGGMLTETQDWDDQRFCECTRLVGTAVKNALKRTQAVHEANQGIRKQVEELDDGDEMGIS